MSDSLSAGAIGPYGRRTQAASCDVTGGVARSAPRASSYLSPALVGRDCPDKGGKAVYARRDVPRGSVLVVWGGSVLTGRELLAAPLELRRLTIQIDDDAYLVSDVEGPGDWINHSCDPNAGLQGQITLVALRDIRGGEEICFDYAMSDGTDYDEFECRCGASSCRRYVSGNDWTRPELIARYRGHFAPYLARRIAAAPHGTPPDHTAEP